MGMRELICIVGERRGTVFDAWCLVTIFL